MANIDRFIPVLSQVIEEIFEHLFQNNHYIIDILLMYSTEYVLYDIIQKN